DSIARLNAALDGRYRIERELGAGGMAVVFLADDLRHERKVALKVLRPEVAAVVGGDRFLAEIKTTANLQHPNILPLFDSGEADGFLFYVMPFVEGESLRGRIEREKQLPVDEAVRIATDVAEALQAAHDEGVIHRDIKPANILMSKGRPLVADFGIALAVSAAGGGRLTETGLSMGTPFYMSPEQASADREPGPASDVYSLGCVLYEMLTGDPPHTASSAQAVLAKILTDRPVAPTEARASVPPHVDAAIRRSLEKLPADRFQRAHDFARALGDPRFVHGAEFGSEPRTRASRGMNVAGAAAVVLLAALAAWGWLRPTAESGAAAPAVRSTLTGFEFSTDAGDHPVISRDGSFIVVDGADNGAPLFIRRSDRTRFEPIPGTERSSSFTLSPDGEWLAFRRDDQLFRIETSGGTAVPIARGFGPHWGVQDRIVFVSLDGVIYSVSPRGGDPVRLQAPGQPLGASPFLLPDGRSVVFHGGDGSGGEAELLVLDIASGTVSSLGVEGRNASYVSTGHLVYADPQWNLMALPFDMESGAATGPPFVAMTEPLTELQEGEVALSVSDAGTAVYVLAAGANRELVEVTREGVESTLPLEPRRYRYPRYSPDGRLIVYEADEDLWLFDRLTGSNERFTTGRRGSRPVWSKDGSYVYYSGGSATVNRKAADGSADAERLIEEAAVLYPLAAIPDGEGFLLNEWRGAERGVDIRILSVGDGAPSVRDYLRADHSEAGGDVSPDGQWVVYQSNESGSAGLYVRRLSDATGQVAVPSGGRRVSLPRWSTDGSAVLWMDFDSGEPELLRSRVTDAGDGPTFAPPEGMLLVEGAARSAASLRARNWDQSPGGERFVFVVDRDPETASRSGPRAEIVVNWFTELLALSGN
ncbi:MAG TPA: protein kinase, partial [Longimicrobiales bacterium]|nr:protein kinase [Longimicrobiales bacterium]